MNPKFFIFGDSHAGTLMRAAQTQSLEFAGGSVMAGMYLNDRFCTVENGRFRMLSELGTTRLGIRLSKSELGPNLLRVNMPIISTVGFNTTNFETQFCDAELAILGSSGANLISSACFEAVVLAARRGAIEFYRLLNEAGMRVYAVLSPQRFEDRQRAVCRGFENVMTRHLSGLGVGIVDARTETTDETGLLRPEFVSARDHVHANEKYGAVVLNKFLAMLESAGETTSSRPRGNRAP